MSENKGFDWVWNVLPQITWYHFLIVTLAGYCAIVDGFSAVYPVFAQYKQDVRCPTPMDTGEVNPNINLTFSQILSLTKVEIENQPYDECRFYRLDYNTCEGSQDFFECAQNLTKDVNNLGSCTAQDAIFDTSNFTSTMPSEFKLACGSTLNALATSLSFVGLFLGSYLAGLSDRFGRKTLIIVMMAASAVFEGLQGVLPSYPAFVIARILVQAANQAAYITYNVYACEVVGPNGRAYTGMVPNFLFAFGYMGMSGMSYLFPAWRTLTLLISGLTFPALLTFWFWPESPRWLYSVGREEEGEKVLSIYLQKSNVKLESLDIVNIESTRSLTPERRFFDTLKQKCQTEEKVDLPKSEKKYNLLTLFTSGKHLALTTINICFQFIVIVAAYYGLSFSAGDLPGDIYVNNVINGLVEVAAYVATFFLLNILGRRALTAGPLLFAGICMLFGMILTQLVVAPWAAELFRWLMFAGKLGVSAAFAVIWIYSAELFPTEIRGNALGMGSMAGRIGGVCAPYLNQMWQPIPWLPPTIYGILCVLGGLALFFLPETSGRPMLNTIEEANEYYSKRARRISVEVHSMSESIKNLSA